MPFENVKVVTDDSFEKFVMRNDIPVVIDFWATWCGPCRALAPIISELADENAGKIAFGKINVDDCQKVAVEYRVNLIPTMIIFKGGVSVERVVGLHKKEELEEILKKYM